MGRNRSGRGAPKVGRPKSGQGAPRIGSYRSRSGKGAPNLGVYQDPPPFIGTWEEATGNKLGYGKKKILKGKDYC